LKDMKIQTMAPDVILTPKKSFEVEMWKSEVGLRKSISSVFCILSSFFDL
jgi:hypothetical protein